LHETTEKMSDDEKEKHLSLFELIEDEDFIRLGQHEENEYSAEVDKETVREAATVAAEALDKDHPNNFVLWKFRFVDEPSQEQNVLPGKFNIETTLNSGW
jgi:cysteinyl-tRNA synthetase